MKTRDSEEADWLIRSGFVRLKKKNNTFENIYPEFVHEGLHTFDRVADLGILENLFKWNAEYWIQLIWTTQLTVPYWMYNMHDFFIYSFPFWRLCSWIPLNKWWQKHKLLNSIRKIIFSFIEILNMIGYMSAVYLFYVGKG